MASKIILILFKNSPFGRKNHRENCIVCQALLIYIILWYDALGRRFHSMQEVLIELTLTDSGIKRDIKQHPSN